MKLVVNYAGWCLIRLATDPDPSDEPRGISGYTFAFADEPPLDRIVRFQPPRRAGFVRSHSPEIGVKVKSSVRTDTGERVLALDDAKVDLAGNPKLENRNWTLTLPGREPIVPFNLRIRKAQLSIARDAPLNPNKPNEPIWEASADVLAAQGAAGINYEPQTVGAATEMWDALEEAQKRLRELTAEHAETEEGTAAAVALEGRIRELKVAVANPEDRRIAVRSYVERFAFAIEGPRGKINDRHGALGVQLDADAPWNVSFWMGGWDPDALAAYVQGSLELPLATPAPSAQPVTTPSGRRSARASAASTASSRVSARPRP